MTARRKQLSRAAADERIQALQALIADKVIDDPALIEKAAEVLESRYHSGLMRYGSYLLWLSILDTAGDPATFRALLLAEDTRTASLRRETIFTGVLSEEERAQVLSRTTFYPD